MSPAGIAVAAILAVSVLSKAGGMPVSMLRAMRDLSLPSALMSPLVAWAHLAVQASIAVTLVIPPLAQISAVAACGLACLYLVIVASRRGRPCRCVVDTPTVIGWPTIIRNVFFVGLTACAALAWRGAAAIFVAAVLTVGFVALELVERHLAEPG